MRLDTNEVQRISERLGSLENRHKLLASYIAVQEDDNVVCAEMGFRPHQIDGAVLDLCTNLHMTYLERRSWRLYVRAAVLLVASPDPAPRAAEPQKRHKIEKHQWNQAQPFLRGFAQAAVKVNDPVLKEIYLFVPKLFAYALSRCGDVSYAEELTQEGLVRALANVSTFKPGANVSSSIASWLCTIVHNFHMSDRRKRRREVADVDDVYANALESLPDQISNLELRELQSALSEIPPDQRQAVLLVGTGSSLDEAAAIVGCPVGTIKSRVFRARSRLAELLGMPVWAGAAIDAEQTP